MRSWGACAALAAMLVLAAPAAARVEIVTHRHVAYRHFGTIQGAVRAARAGDWILIDRGTYRGPVVITKDRLHLRGMDRNRVVLDGRHRKNVNGIEVRKADGVWIQNLTVRNFDRRGKDGEKRQRDLVERRRRLRPDRHARVVGDIPHGL